MFDKNKIAVLFGIFLFVNCYINASDKSKLDTTKISKTHFLDPVVAKLVVAGGGLAGYKVSGAIVAKILLSTAGSVAAYYLIDDRVHSGRAAMAKRLVHGCDKELFKLVAESKGADQLVREVNFKYGIPVGVSKAYERLKKDTQKRKDAAQLLEQCYTKAAQFVTQVELDKYCIIKTKLDQQIKICEDAMNQLKSELRSKL